MDEVAQQTREAAPRRQSANDQWWALIDKRIQEHLENARQFWTDVGGQVISDIRFELRKEMKQGDTEIQRIVDEKLSALEQRLKSVPGKLPPVKTWRKESVTYGGEVVVHEGAAYQALKDKAQTPGGSDWVCVACAGRDGHDAPALNIRGTFDTHENYKHFDIVACDGASFVATRDGPGICPGEGWRLLSRQGKSGRRGERGEPGPRGIPGKQGEAGPTIAAWKVERAAYLAIPLLSNGQEGPVLDLRELFEQYLSETSDWGVEISNAASD
jgi:hypothetical protein